MLLQPRLAILAGLLSFLAGVVTGVLFAPARGARTRRRLVRGGERLADRADEVEESTAAAFGRARRRIA